MGQRQLQSNEGAAAASVPDLDFTAQCTCSLMHPEQTQTARFSAPVSDAAAVILDKDFQHFRTLFYRDFYNRRLGVLLAIPERFLRDAVHAGLHRFGKIVAKRFLRQLTP